MGIMQVSSSVHIASICMPFRVGSPAIVRMVWSAPSAFLVDSDICFFIDFLWFIISPRYL